MTKTPTDPVRGSFRYLPPIWMFAVGLAFFGPATWLIATDAMSHSGPLDEGLLRLPAEHATKGLVALALASGGVVVALVWGLWQRGRAVGVVVLDQRGLTAPPRPLSSGTVTLPWDSITGFGHRPGAFTDVVEIHHFGGTLQLTGPALGSRKDRMAFVDALRSNLPHGPV